MTDLPNNYVVRPTAVQTGVGSGSAGAQSPSTSGKPSAISSVVATTAAATQARTAAIQSTSTASSKPTGYDLASETEESQKQIQDAVAQLQDELSSKNISLGFAVDPVSKRSVIFVSNKETGELIRQVPAESVLRVAQSIENLKGLIFDEEF
jgi:flagellar protein FlaG